MEINIPVKKILIFMVVIFLFWDNPDSDVQAVGNKTVTNKESTIRQLTPEELEFVETTYKEVKTYIAAGNYEESLYSLEKIFVITKNYKDTRELYTSIGKKLGLTLSVKKEKNEVASQYEILDKLSPKQRKYLESSYELAKKQILAGRYIETLETLKGMSLVIDHYKKSRDLYDLAVNGLIEEKKRKKRLQDEINTENTDREINLLVAKAKKAVETKDIQESKRLFSQILKLDPENYDVPQLQIQLNQSL